MYYKINGITDKKCPTQTQPFLSTWYITDILKLFNGFPYWKAVFQFQYHPWYYKTSWENWYQVVFGSVWNIPAYVSFHNAALVNRVVGWIEGRTSINRIGSELFPWNWGRQTGASHTRD